MLRRVPGSSKISKSARCYYNEHTTISNADYTIPKVLLSHAILSSVY